MKIKSLIVAVALGFVTLGAVGCGSSGSNTDYVATTADVEQQPTGALSFAFAKLQAAFTVDNNATRLRFEFSDGVSSTPIYTQVREFENTITINNVPVAAGTVRITGFDVTGVPLFTITQAIDVVGGKTTEVNATSNAVPVLLQDIRVVSGDLTQIGTELTQVSVPVGGTFQSFLAAEYSSGDVILVGNLATYSIDAGGSGFASVNELGTVSGIASGSTMLMISFSGQQILVPVVVTEGVAINFSSIKLENVQPISVSSAAGTRLQVIANNQFGLNSSDPRLSYSVDIGGFTVTNGVLNVDAAIAAGTTATVTVTYTNPSGSQLTTTGSVVVAASAPAP